VHGGTLDECPDDERDWFPQRDICWPSAQLEAAKRLYALRFKDRPFHDGSYEPQAEEPSAKHPFHYLDGVAIWLSPTELRPDDDFIGRSSLAQEPDGNEGESDDPAD